MTNLAALGLLAASVSGLQITNLAALGLLAASAAGAAQSNQFEVCGAGGCVSKPLALHYFTSQENCADLCAASEECSGYEVSGRSRFGLGSCMLYTGEVAGEGSGSGPCYCKLGELGFQRAAV